MCDEAGESFRNLPAKRDNRGRSLRNLRPVNYYEDRSGLVSDGSVGDPSFSLSRHKKNSDQAKMKTSRRKNSNASGVRVGEAGKADDAGKADEAGEAGEADATPEEPTAPPPKPPAVGDDIASLSRLFPNFFSPDDGSVLMHKIENACLNLRTSETVRVVDSLVECLFMNILEKYFKKTFVKIFEMLDSDTGFGRMIAANRRQRRKESFALLRKICTERLLECPHCLRARVDAFVFDLALPDRVFVKRRGRSLCTQILDDVRDLARLPFFAGESV